MKADTYDQQGKKVLQVLLPKEIFEVKMNKDLVHQVAVSQMANRRQIIAHTKSRAEVSGGGRKPWRQKGTGRARHGSTRSPIWRGGGITFGPTSKKNFKKKINKKMKRKALFMVLSSKAKEKTLILMDDLKAEKGKTKLIAGMLKKLPCKGKRVLIVIPGLDKNIVLASRNIPRVGVMQAKDLNALDLLNSKYLIMPKTAIKVIKDTFLK